MNAGLRLPESRLTRACGALIVLACLAPSPAAAFTAGPARVLDDFADITPWRVVASDDVDARLYRAPAPGGNALCLAFDFGSVAGYAALRRELPISYGSNYEFAFDLSGDAPASTLQFKLVDGSGENVWWVNRPDQDFTHEWKHVRFNKRQFTFAWGPSQDHEMKQSAAIEFTIVRGLQGGKGSVCIDALSFRDLPATTATAVPQIQASSTLAPSRPDYALDGRRDTAWHSDPAAGPEQSLTIDFARPREFGGLVLHWLADAHASRYDIDFSDDGRHWRTVRHVVSGNGDDDPHLLTESETRYLRLRMYDGPGRSYALADIDIKDPAFGATPNAFFEALAGGAPRGLYPRSFSGEQVYWTVVGTDGGAAQGLLSEDGALDIGPRSGSIEPWLLADGKLVNWADVQPAQSLLDGYLPIPDVTWRHGGIKLRVSAFGSGERDRAQVNAIYTLDNLSAHARNVTLALAVRPFQVNPPTQFLNVPGGIARISDLAWDGKALHVNGAPRVFSLQGPDAVVVADFDAGDISQLLARPQSTAATEVHDESGFASAILLYRVELPPRGSRKIGIVVPLAGAPRLPQRDASEWLDREQAAAAAGWREKLNRVALRIPTEGKPLMDTLRTALAHILLARTGPALRPGTRSYARSWIRDGAMIADALLRLGHANAVREYIGWFAPHQFTNGKVPCCVDDRGADPTPENDSSGEFIHLVAEYYRYTHDRQWLQTMWPHVVSAATYMDALRLGERAARNGTTGRRELYGLMPASISHEGYSDRPAYSYWDDFWTLAGFDGAVAIANALDRRTEARRFAGQREQFRRDLHASLRATIAAHGLGYIPASADRADFDPTSTTIALSVAAQQDALPQPQLEQTFERYWNEFRARRDGSAGWDVYTPYEIRNAGAFVRLGWRERAVEMLDFMLSGRRPAAWNGWAEIVGRKSREPRFIGDMPHAWVASDFIRSVLDLFAYERESDQALVLAAGVPVAWLGAQGVGVERLRTPYGELTFGLRSDRRRLTLTIGDGLAPPPGGLVFRWPYRDAPGATRVNGRRVLWHASEELVIRSLPARITVALAK